MNRRRYRGRKRHNAHRGNNIRKQAITFVIVIFISVAAGYLTATQLLGPALGLESQQTFFEFIKEKQNVEKQTEDTKENKENKDNKESEITVVEDKTEEEEESGFALQYGSFSTRSGAQECADELNATGIEAEIIEKDGMYKVIGELFDTKSEAENYRETNPQDQEVFITEIK